MSSLNRILIFAILLGLLYALYIYQQQINSAKKPNDTHVTKNKGKNNQIKHTKQIKTIKNTNKIDEEMVVPTKIMGRSNIELIDDDSENFEDIQSNNTKDTSNFLDSKSNYSLGSLVSMSSEKDFFFQK